MKTISYFKIGDEINQSKRKAVTKPLAYLEVKTIYCTHNAKRKVW